jgi:hypothetical protein
MFVCFHMESSQKVPGRFAECSGNVLYREGYLGYTIHRLTPIFKSFLTKAHTGHTFEIGCNRV